MVALLAKTHTRQICFISIVNQIKIVLRHHQFIFQILWWLFPFLGLRLAYWLLALSFSPFTRRRCNLLFLNAEVVTVLLVIEYFVYLLLLRIVSLLFSAFTFGDCFP